MSFILASGSQSRRSILEKAGLDFKIIPADVDESVLKSRFTGTPGDLALHLAEAKALEVSRREECLVLGADQVLDLDGQVYDKARSPEEARDKLLALRGKTHWLRGGLVAARDGQVIWTHQSACKMTVRKFSDAFLEDYLTKAGDILTKGVGAYAFEGVGAQIFDEVEGDYYAVLGLPLLPVLSLLRDEGLLPV